MKKQKPFSTLNNSFTVLWSIIFLSALIFGMAQAVLAQQPSVISLEVGEIKSKTPKKQVNPESVNILVNRPTIATARFDGNANRFRFEGLSAGVARITITGTYRQLIVGGVIQENAIRFRLLVDVTVLPGFRPDDTRKIEIQVSSGANRVYQIQNLMGQSFANASEENVNWRGVNLTGDNNGIATGELFDRNPIKLRVSGVATGKTTLTLQGERINRRVWQKVIRILEITVGAGTDADAELRRQLRRLQGAAQTDFEGETGLPEERLRELIQQFENFIASIERLVAEERRRPNSNIERIRRLNSIIDDGNKDLQRLRRELANMSNTIQQIDWNVTATEYRGRNNQRFTFRCGPNGPNKSVWGTGIYTDDSSICRAAVHQGFITIQSGGIVTIEIRPGLKSYAGSTQNGVTSKNWGSWSGSFVFIR